MKKNFLLTILLTFLVNICPVLADNITYYAYNAGSDNVSINAEATTGSKVAAIPIGASVRLTSNQKYGTKNCSSGWYQAYYEEGKIGYICSKTVNLYSVSSNLSTDANFLEQLNKFPDSYKPFIIALHKKYPNARFTAYNTNLNWDDVIKEESSVVGKNTISTSLASGKDGWLDPQAMDVTYDGGTARPVNIDMIKYYMDPRNFLNEKYIFQFEQLSFNENTHKISGVENSIANSFMNGKNIKDNNNYDVSYAKTIFDASKNNSISPYYISSKIIQEVGSNGTSKSISGTYTGYENLYNYFNINAYAANGRTSIQNALYFAKGVSSSSYGRPWNTPYKAIVGGTEWVAKRYVNKGQDNTYSQKFDIIGPEYYSNQYMQNIQGACTEGGRVYYSYKKIDDFNNISFNFKIPVYNGMPSITYFASINVGVSTNKGTNNQVPPTNNSGNDNQNQPTTPAKRQILVGDANGDNNINSIDLLRIKKHILGMINLQGDEFKKADTNNDGKIDAFDILKVKKHILGMINLGKREIE